ncbi:SgcJ/EcaC family oxidoreductase (plasmid) [Streptomyces sp. NBC_00846]|uniref:SgcJ/EcaC family oxidoreductase n=1 Tax=Streptomyces sp. NBC_00846 TaxID=2975849 RepID=UPI002F914338|nr:SgcJ/EcaC family oxidoreductase [Streptomyces sp. NBC_00846]
MPNTTGSTHTDQAGAAAVPQRIVAAWASHDAKKFAAVFTEKGTMILPGTFKKGREAVEEFMTEAFAGPYKGTRVTGEPISVEFLSPDSAVLVTAGGILLPGEKEVSAERSIRATWVVVKEGTGWQLAAYQNTPVN